MRNHYGESFQDFCYECCNCQLEARGSDKLICITFGGGVVWDPKERACSKMFNVPFRGIRPRIETLYDQLYLSDTEPGQISLFDI